MDTASTPATSTQTRPRRNTRFGRAAGFAGFRAHTPDAIQEGAAGREAVERRDRTYRFALVCADLASVLFALFLCVSVLGDDHLRALSCLSLPLVVLVNKLKGLYDRDELLLRKTTVDEAPQLFQGATLYTLVFWLLESVFLVGRLGDLQVVVLWGALFGSAVLGRGMARATAMRLTSSERCLFIGDAASYGRLHSKFDDHRIDADLVGRMSLQRLTPGTGRRAHEQDLRELLAWTDVHRIIIEPQALPAHEMLDFVRAAKSIGVRVSLLPRVLDVVGSSVVFDDLNGLTVLGVRRFGLTRSSRFVKRGFDLAGAGVAFIAAAPVMGLIAIAVKRDSPGPVLFRQTRVGRDGRHFRICKFRTMSSDAEQRKEELRGVAEANGGLFKLENDPRVTRVGRLLRKTSLDELPQLFNVLAGDMSLVGPRPLIVDEDSQIKGFDRRRLQLTPGMTGPWQILGSARVPLPEMVKMDYLYVAGWSLWQDVKILLRTVPYVLARKGC
jgi:exopolysaccharide biosynthesis polyprenyl glycosylphosphotransferase